MKSDILAQDARLIGAYVASLEGIAKSLTQKGQIDEALKISQLAEAAQKELQAVKTAVGLE